MRGVGLRPCVHGGGVCMECCDLQEVLITIILLLVAGIIRWHQLWLHTSRIRQLS